MAKVKGNLITKGLSGKIGNVVFRVRNGITYACAAPQRSNKKPTAEQYEIRLNFARYVEYAKSVLNNGELLALYQNAVKRGKSVFNLAFADAAKAPVIHNIVRLAGCFEDQVLIEATDNFKVAVVAVDIFDGKGRLVETGYAEEYLNNFWNYIMKNQNLKNDQLKFVVTATDFPGNSVEKSVSI